MQEFLAPDVLVQVLSEYKVIAPILFILLRSLSVIIPPIPGIIFDLPGILVFGWVGGLIYAEIGVMLGAMIAFFIARTFREPAIRRIKFLRKVAEWEKAVSEEKKFWALTVLRLPTNITFDYISYAAGLTAIKPRVFFFSTLLGNIPAMFVVYYFGGLSFQNGLYYSLAFLAALIIFGFILIKSKTLRRIYKIDKFK